MTIAVSHYAKGIACAVLGDVSTALKEYTSFTAACSKVPTHHVLHNNTCEALLNVADRMLCGEIAYRQGDQYQMNM